MHFQGVNSETLNITFIYSNIDSDEDLIEYKSKRTQSSKLINDYKTKLELGFILPTKYHHDLSTLRVFQDFQFPPQLPPMSPDPVWI